MPPNLRKAKSVDARSIPRLKPCVSAIPMHLNVEELQLVGQDGILRADWKSTPVWLLEFTRERGTINGK